MTDNTDFKNTAFSLNITLTLVHVAIIVSSFILKCWILFFFNLITVMFFIYAFILIQKKHVIFYLIFAITEVIIQMIVATICLGWESGFHQDAFGTISAVFYTKYIYSHEKRAKRISFLITFLSIAIYMFLWFACHYIKPIYNLSKTATDILYISNSILIFEIVVQLLWKFSHVAIREESILKNKAELDELTRLSNRHKMMDMLSEAHQRTEYMNLEVNYSICIFDIDDFKIINDTFGHNSGDMILREVASIMNTLVQEKHSIIGRWGGEEFLLLQEYRKDDPLGEEKCKNTIKLILENVRNRVFPIETGTLNITLTGGFEIHKKGDNISSTIREADRKLYEGKASGKNIVIY